MNTEKFVVADQPAVYGFNAISMSYSTFVCKLFKHEDRVLMLHHAKGGVCEEAGELSDAIKRVTTYGKQLNDIAKDGQTYRQKIVEEIGDIRFYLQAVMDLIGISEDEVLTHNVRKLSERYVGLEYSNEAANARADKKEGDDK